MVDFTQSEHGPALTEPAPDPQPNKEVDVALPKRTTPPAFQFYASDFLSSDKVSRMSLAEVGVYILLLCHAWLAYGLPNDHAQIARYVRMPTSRLKRLWAGPLGECFVLKGGRLVNPRQERIRADLFAFIDKQQTNGRRGGRPRKPTDNPNETQTEPKSNPNKSSSVSDLQSSSSNKKERTDVQGSVCVPGAPLHQTHKAHAHCGRVCVPGDLHGQFVRSRNSPDADKELRDWYLAVDLEWSVGSKKDTNTGGNDYRFWRARFDERWPSADAASKPRPGDRTAGNIESLNKFIARGAKPHD